MKRVTSSPTAWWPRHARRLGNRGSEALARKRSGSTTAKSASSRREVAANKRHVGLGFTGLDDTLCILRLRYDRPEATAMGARISEFMRANDHGWLALKLESLAKTPGDEGFDMPFPPHGERKRMPSVVAAMARLIQYRVERLGAFEREGPTPVLDAMFSRKEPKTGTDGTLSWTVDVFNPATGEDFVLGLKEITLPDGVTRPYSVWLAGNYPRALDGLTKLLSFDMRVLDPAWIGMKLRKLLDYPEPLGDFMAFIPGTRRQTNYPSTVAYLAQLILHRYAMLGILDENGVPLQQMGILQTPAGSTAAPPHRPPPASCAASAAI